MFTLLNQTLIHPNCACRGKSGLKHLLLHDLEIGGLQSAMNMNENNEMGWLSLSPLVGCTIGGWSFAQDASRLAQRRDRRCLNDHSNCWPKNSLLCTSGRGYDIHTASDHISPCLYIYIHLVVQHVGAQPGHGCGCTCTHCDQRLYVYDVYTCVGMSRTRNRYHTQRMCVIG